MKVVTSDMPVEFGDHSLFLAGPTPRSSDVRSWRIDALHVLSQINYDGTVLVPERRDWATKFDYDDQVEWEYAGLQGAAVVICWVPRDLVKLPGFTTNVEFGHYVNSGRFLYGRPDDAPKVRYLDWLYGKVTGRVPHNSLKNLLIEAAGFRRLDAKIKHGRLFVLTDRDGGCDWALQDENYPGADGVVTFKEGDKLTIYKKDQVIFDEVLDFRGYQHPVCPDDSKHPRWQEFYYLFGQHNYAKVEMT